MGCQCTGKGEQLALSGREVVAALANLFGISTVEPADEAVCVHVLCGFDYRVIGHGPVPKPDVLLHGVGEQEDVLQHDTEPPSELVERPVAHIDSIDQHTPRINVVETTDQFRDGRLARPGHADHGQVFAGAHLEGEVADYRFSFDVGERHVVELYLAACRRHRRGSFGAGHGGFGVEDTEDPLAGRNRRLHDGVLGREIADRYEKFVHVFDEGHQGPEAYADGQRSA